MNRVTFITGNQKKADFMAKHLKHDIAHQKVELDELQSLDLKEIVEHKARQAYDQIGSPVLVEDVSFSIEALGGRLPGPFVKWFIEENGLEGLCRLADLTASRRASTEICYAYYDGKTMKFFDGKVEGTVPEMPAGDDGFGWNAVFIPDGQTKTNAEMSDEETAKYGLRTSTVFPEIKNFLTELDKIN